VAEGVTAGEGGRTNLLLNKQIGPMGSRMGQQQGDLGTFLYFTYGRVLSEIEISEGTTMVPVLPGMPAGKSLFSAPLRFYSFEAMRDRLAVLAATSSSDNAALVTFERELYTGAVDNVDDTNSMFSKLTHADRRAAFPFDNWSGGCDAIIDQQNALLCAPDVIQAEESADEELLGQEMVLEDADTEVESVFNLSHGTARWRIRYPSGEAEAARVPEDSFPEVDPVFSLSRGTARWRSRYPSGEAEAARVPEDTVPEVDPVFSLSHGTARWRSRYPSGEAEAAAALE
jgi:hypothetical protein